VLNHGFTIAKVCTECKILPFGQIFPRGPTNKPYGNLVVGVQLIVVFNLVGNSSNVCSHKSQTKNLSVAFNVFSFHKVKFLCLLGNSPLLKLLADVLNLRNKKLTAFPY
jgi:hypothetical protein